jgi:uridine kinase
MARGDASPEGYYRDSFDYPGLIAQLLEPLGPGGSRRYRTEIFDHRKDAPVQQPARAAEPDAILLVEGVFLHRPELREHWDISVFLAASFAVTVARAEERDQELFGSTAAVRARYSQRYVPGQRLYLSECRPWELATVVVQNDDPSNPQFISIKPRVDPDEPSTG